VHTFGETKNYFGGGLALALEGNFSRAWFWNFLFNLEVRHLQQCAPPYNQINLISNCSILAKMRPLTEVETKTLFEKLATYCGKGISNLIADPSSKSDRYVFRIQVDTPFP